MTYALIIFVSTIYICVYFAKVKEGCEKCFYK